MKVLRIRAIATVALGLSVAALAASGQEFALDSAVGLELVNVEAAPETLEGRQGVRLAADPEVVREAAAKRRKMAEEMRARGEQPRGPGAFESLRTNHLAVIEGVEFGNGTIEVEVSGQPAAGAQQGARGFVGIAWRLQDDYKTYDCFYLRPHQRPFRRPGETEPYSAIHLAPGMDLASLSHRNPEQVRDVR